MYIVTGFTSCTGTTLIGVGAVGVVLIAQQGKAATTDAAASVVIEGDDCYINSGKVVCSSGGYQPASAKYWHLAENTELDINGFQFEGNHVDMAANAVLSNTGGDRNGYYQQFQTMTLSGNATVNSTGWFGVVGKGYAETTLNLNGHTLTKTGNEGFLLVNTTVTGGGSINITAGELRIGAIADANATTKATIANDVDFNLTQGANVNIIASGNTLSAAGVRGAGNISGEGKLVLNGAPDTAYTLSGTVDIGALEIRGAGTHFFTNSFTSDTVLLNHADGALLLSGENNINGIDLQRGTLSLDGASTIRGQVTLYDGASWQYNADSGISFGENFKLNLEHLSSTDGDNSSKVYTILSGTGNKDLSGLSISHLDGVIFSGKEWTFGTDGTISYIQTARELSAPGGAFTWNTSADNKPFAVNGEAMSFAQWDSVHFDSTAMATLTESISASQLGVAANVTAILMTSGHDVTVEEMNLNGSLIYQMSGGEEISQFGDLKGSGSLVIQNSGSERSSYTLTGDGGEFEGSISASGNTDLMLDGSDLLGNDSVSINIGDGASLVTSLSLNHIHNNCSNISTTGTGMVELSVQLVLIQRSSIDATRNYKTSGIFSINANNGQGATRYFRVGEGRRLVAENKLSLESFADLQIDGGYVETGTLLVGNASTEYNREYWAKLTMTDGVLKIGEMRFCDRDIANVINISGGSLEITGQNAIAFNGNSRASVRIVGADAEKSVTLKALQNNWRLDGAGYNTAPVIGNVTIDSANTRSITLANVNLTGSVQNNAELTLAEGIRIAEGAEATLSGNTVEISRTINNGGTLTLNTPTVTLSRENLEYLSASTVGADVRYSVDGSDAMATKDGNGFRLLENAGYYLVTGGECSVVTGSQVQIRDNRYDLFVDEQGIGFAFADRVRGWDYYVNSGEVTVGGNSASTGTSVAEAFVLAQGTTLHLAGANEKYSVGELLCRANGAGNVVLDTNVTLSGNNATVGTGKLSIGSGVTLTLGNGQYKNASVASFSSVEIDGGSVYYNNNTTTLNNLTVKENGAIWTHADMGTGLVTFAGTTTLDGNLTMTAQYNGQYAMEKLAGSGNLTLNRKGSENEVWRLTIHDASEYTGTLSLNKVQVELDSPLGAGARIELGANSVLSASQGALNLSGATLSMVGAGQINADLNLANAAITRTGAVPAQGINLNSHHLILDNTSYVEFDLDVFSNDATVCLFSGVSSLLNAQNEVLELASDASFGDFFSTDIQLLKDSALRFENGSLIAQLPSVEVPEGYTARFVAHATDISPNDSKMAYILVDDVTVEAASSAWLKNSGDFLIFGYHSASDETTFSPYSLVVKDSVNAPIVANMLSISGLESVCFIDNAATASGGAIYAYEGSVTLSGNGEVTFSGNTASSEYDSAYGGAIYADVVTLSENEVVTFSGNTASSEYDSVYGGAIDARQGAVTLSDNGAVTFSGNTVSASGEYDEVFGGAIYATSGTVTLSGNGEVTFSGNTASSTSSSADGGAIYASVGTVTLSGNGDVTFSGNTASSTDYYAFGGAIYASGGTVTLSGNGEVTFSGNTASSTDSSAYGGAIYATTVTLSGNGEVTFSGNTASASGKYDSAYGGAIDATTVTLSGNGAVTFSGNMASSEDGSAHGGAIDATTVTLSDNDSVTFSGNTVSGSYSDWGGAISAGSGTVELSGNGDVLFEKNAEVTNDTYRLRSIYTGDLNLSASAGKKIEFRDSIYANIKVNLNAEGTGDIIFTGETTMDDLLAVKKAHLLAQDPNADVSNLTVSDDEIADSRRSELGHVELFGGPLLVQHQAKLQISSFFVNRGTDATLVLEHGHVDAGYFIFDSGNTLSLIGENTLSTGYGKITGTMQFAVDSTHAANALVSHSGFVDLTETPFDIQAEQAIGTYQLLSLQNGAVVKWNDDHTFTTSGVEASRLVWNNGVLYWDIDGQIAESKQSLGDYIFSSDWVLQHVTDKNQIIGVENRASCLDADVEWDGLASSIVDSTTSHVFITGEQSIDGSPLYSFAHNHATARAFNVNSLVFVDLKDVSFSGNSVSVSYPYWGGVIEARTVTLMENGSVTFSGNSARIGGAIYAGTVTLMRNGDITFSGNLSTESSGAIEARTVTLIDNGDITFSGNTARSIYDGVPNYGGAISAGTVTLRGNGDVCFSENTIFSNNGDNFAYPASGGAIFAHTVELSGNRNVNFSMNTVSASGPMTGTYGGAIGALWADMVTLSGNGNVCFSGNMVSSEYYLANGGAIYADDGTVTLSGNGDVLFEKNTEVEKGIYRLRSIYMDGGILNLSANEGKKIEFRDSIYASGTVNLNEDGAGDIIFTGASTEADLQEMKGSAGTADEITNSRTSMVEGTTTLYGGRLRIEEGAVYQGRDIIVEDGANATLMLKNGTVDSSGYSITIGKSDTLSVTGESSITADTLVMKAGSNMEILLTEANETGDAALTLTGSLSNEGMTLVLPGSEYLALGTYKLLTSAEEYDFSGWTLSGATTEQLSWIDGTLCYTGGHEWNYVLSEGDTIQDSYTGNVIINGGNITLSKSLAVNAIAGVEKTGNLVVNKGSVSITSGNTLNSGLVVKNGHVSNQGTITKSITLEGGTVSGSGSFAGLVMTGGILVVGNSPGIQSYSGAADLQGGKVVFSVAGSEVATEERVGWSSGTYSTMEMNGNALTFGSDVNIEIAFGGDALVSALKATDDVPMVVELAIAQNIGNILAYTQEVLAQLAAQTTFIVTDEAEGLDALVTLSPGKSLADIVKSVSYSVSGNSLVLNVSMAGNGKGLKEDAVPEPTTATLSLLGLAGLMLRRRRK